MEQDQLELAHFQLREKIEKARLFAKAARTSAHYIFPIIAAEEKDKHGERTEGLNPSAEGLLDLLDWLNDVLKREHVWKTDYSIPVLDFNPPIYTEICAVCGEHRTKQEDLSGTAVTYTYPADFDGNKECSGVKKEQT